MTQHDIAARAPNYVAGLLSFICLVSLLVLICHAPAQDAADDDKARAHVEQQARAAAQPDTWDKLDAQGKRLVNYEGIRK